MDELHAEYEQVLATYNEEIKEILKIENELARYKSQHVRQLEIWEYSRILITSSLGPLAPTIPIFKIPKNPLYSQDPTKEDIEEEKSRLIAMKIEVWER